MSSLLKLKNINNMEIKDIANRLVELCRAGDYQTCYQELYAPNAKSIEPNQENGWDTIEGMDAFAEKGKQWNEGIEEFYSGAVSDPIVSGNHFSIEMSMDYKPKGTERLNHSEICVYKVENGKIVSEQFFY